MVEFGELSRSIQSIDLTKIFRGGRDIKLLRAEVPLLLPSFTLVRYVIRLENQWIEPEYGLRLDLDKRVFLDSFANKTLKRYIKRSARKIVDHISSVLY